MLRHPSLKLGKGSKHCTREHCKARTKAGGRIELIPRRRHYASAEFTGGSGHFDSKRRKYWSIDVIPGRPILNACNRLVTTSSQLAFYSSLCFTRGRILEVGDDEAVREFIAAICKNRGFDVVQARCGDEALNLYRKRGPFVLVLSDLYWYSLENRTNRHGASKYRSQRMRHNGLTMARLLFRKSMNE